MLRFDWCRQSPVHLLLEGSQFYMSLPRWVFGLCCYTSLGFLPRRPQNLPNRDLYLLNGQDATAPDRSSVSVFAGSRWMLYVPRQFAAYLALSESPCGNQCMWDWKVECNMSRNRWSFIALPQYCSGWVIAKNFSFVASSQIDSLQYSRLASISSAFGIHSAVFS